ncbi:MAG: TetR/AcrR family transcriptional regulator, partial [Streptosporangiaceae bacterium]
MRPRLRRRTRTASPGRLAAGRPCRRRRRHPPMPRRVPRRRLLLRNTCYVSCTIADDHATVVLQNGKMDTMPKVVDHAARRAELVDAAWRVIAEEGLEAATMRRIAEAAGCTTGRVTHYFDS